MRLHSQKGRQQVEKVISFPLFSSLRCSVQFGVVFVQQKRDVEKTERGNLGYMMYEVMLREQSLPSLEKRLLTGDLTAVFHCLNGAIEKVGPNSSQRQTCSRPRDLNHKLQQGKFRLGVTRLCSHLEWLSTGRGCPESLCTLCPWRQSKFHETRP